MIPAVQVQAFRATGDAKYLDRAALTMTAYFDKKQQTNGLFFHGTTAPFYWGGAAMAGWRQVQQNYSARCRRIIPNTPESLRAIAR